MADFGEAIPDSYHEATTTTRRSICSSYLQATAAVTTTAADLLQVQHAEQSQDIRTQLRQGVYEVHRDLRGA